MWGAIPLPSSPKADEDRDERLDFWPGPEHPSPMTAGPSVVAAPPGSTEGAAAPDRTGRRVVALFGPHRRRVAVVAGTILVSSLLGVALPFLTQAVLDRALFPRLADNSVGPPRIGLLLALVGASIAVTLFGALLGVVQTWLTTRLGKSVMRELRDRMFAHLQRMELAFFTGTPHGRDPESAGQRRRRSAVGGHRHGELDPGQRRDRRQRAGRDARPVVAADVGRGGPAPAVRPAAGACGPGAAPGWPVPRSGRSPT